MAETEVAENPENPPANPVVEPPQKSALWLIVLLTSLFGLGVWDFFAGIEPNGCAMTYMYEYPTYIPVGVSSQVQSEFPNYGLYVYGEGASVEPLSQGVFSGIPVLFIPGNAGSYKQVRSLASVALRKAMEEDFKGDFHFDYFAVDLEEEFSAIYGGSLRDQSTYVSHCISQILKLYKGQANAPKSLVLVGHSIGGLVAKSLFVRPKFDHSTISAVITLATPHQPVITMDSHTRDFYDQVDDHWNRTRTGTLRDVVFVSIGGGDRDLQVRSGLTNSRYADINVVTTNSPLVWVSTDHRCITWCKQLVLALSRALFDSVDQTKQITKDVAKLRNTFEYQLLDRSTGKHYKTSSELFVETMKFNRDGFWSDHMKRQFSFEREYVESNTHIVVMTFDDPRHRFMTVDASGIDYNDWIFGCKDTTVYKNTRICDIGHNLSKHSKIVPSQGKRKMAQFDMHQLKKEFGYTHVVVYIPKGKKHVKVHLDVYNEFHRHVEYQTPRWITFFQSYPIVAKTAERSIFYNVTLLEMDQPWQAYDIIVKPLGRCTDDAHFGLMRFVTPWAYDATQKLIAHNETSRLTAKLQLTKPSDLGVDPINPRMDILLNPNCQYSIEIQSAVHKMWGQMVRFYAPMILPLSIAVLLLALTFQLKAVEAENHCSFILSVLTSQVTPISVVMPGRLVGYIASTAFLAKFLPMSDFQRLADSGLDFGVLPIVLFFVSIGLVSVITMAAWACVILFGNVANQAVIRFFAPVSPHEVVTDLAVSGMTKMPFILSGVLIALTMGTCGSLALCLGTFIHFVHLFKMYEDYLLNRMRSSMGLKAAESNLSQINFQLTLGMLWTMMSVLNLPALLAWTRGLPLQTHLNPDPSLIPAVILSGSLAVLWGESTPRNLQFYNQLSGLVQFLAILIVVFGSISMYRVNYFVSAVFVALSFHQLLAPKKAVPVIADADQQVASSETEASVAKEAPKKKKHESGGGDD